MKSTLRISLSALSLLAAPAFVPLHAQPTAARYIVVDLGQPGLGGSTSIAFGLSNAGRVGGQASLPSGNFHGFLSGIGHTLIDLGTLGGPNSGASGPNFFNALAVISDTSTKDPLGEDYCGFGTHLNCLGAVWRAGALTSLAPLGGNNSFAQAINNVGQVTGWAENSIQDPTCAGPQVLRSQAVVWGPRHNEIHPLPPLPGDTVSFALGINDFGQVVGSSGICSNTPLIPFAVGPHAVLWENGTPNDLGSLSPSGSALNVAAGINDLGAVVGGSRTPSADHTFLWTRATGMHDLGLLDTDLGNLPGSGMGAINNRGQVVGISCVNDALCDMSNPDFMARAYLWQNGKMTDLNSLVVGGAPLYLIFAFQIDDAGEIAGFGATSTGEIHAFEAVPTYSATAHEKSSAEGRASIGPMPLPNDARQLLRRRLAGGSAGMLR